MSNVTAHSSIFFKKRELETVSLMAFKWDINLGGLLKYKHDRGGGGWGPTYFFGSKIFNSCIFLG